MLFLLCFRFKGSPITKLLGIAQPIHSTANIQGNAYILAEHLKLEMAVIDQTPIFDQLAPLVESAVSFTIFNRNYNNFPCHFLILFYFEYTKDCFSILFCKNSNISWVIYIICYFFFQFCINFISYLLRSFTVYLLFADIILNRKLSSKNNFSLCFLI